MTTTDYQSTGPSDPRPGANQSGDNRSSHYEPGANRSGDDGSGGNQPGAGQVPTAAAGAYDAPYQPSAGYYQPPTGPYQPPLPPVSYRARRSTAALIIGAVIVVSGLLTAISGGALLALFGAGNVLNSGSHVVSTPSTALVADMGTITNTTGFEYITGTPTLHLSADSFGGEPVFVGVAPADDVARYLSGAAIDRIKDFDLSPFHLDTVGRDGAQAVQAPGEQNFWVASAQSATGADLDWAIQDGHYQVVIMNADGTANVHTTASVGVSLPSSSGLWILVISIGGVFIVVGGVLMAIGAGRPVKS